MAKLTKKKWLIFGTLAAVSLVAGGIYLSQQVKNALKYSYSFSRFVIKKIGLDVIDFDLFFNLKNPSKLKYTITEITTQVKVNNQVIANLVNYTEQVILPESTTEIGINVQVKPSDLANQLGQKWTTLVANLDKIGDQRVIVDMNFKIGYLGKFLSVNVPYQYSFPVKDLFPKK